jgi:4-oxalocrotonate tautomerase
MHEGWPPTSSQPQQEIPEIALGNDSAGGGAATVKPLSAVMQENVMPFINIQITREGATAEQKAELIEGVTDLMVRVLGKNPATTFVIIDEVDTDNWGIGGKSVTALRKKT